MRNAVSWKSPPGLLPRPERGGNAGRWMPNFATLRPTHETFLSRALNTHAKRSVTSAALAEY